MKTEAEIKKAIASVEAAGSVAPNTREVLAYVWGTLLWILDDPADADKNKKFDVFLKTSEVIDEDEAIRKAGETRRSVGHPRHQGMDVLKREIARKMATEKEAQ